MREYKDIPGLREHDEAFHSTRHCPSCNSTDLVIEPGDALINEWSTTSCKKCGRKLQEERLDRPTWTDPEWVKSSEN